MEVEKITQTCSLFFAPLVIKKKIGLLSRGGVLGCPLQLAAGQASASLLAPTTTTASLLLRPDSSTACLLGGALPPNIGIAKSSAQITLF